MPQLEYSSKWSQIDYSNAPEKMRNIDYRMANVIFVKTGFTVCFRIQEKEKQKTHFPNANLNKEKV